MAQLAEGFCFDLANALSGYSITMSYLFKSLRSLIEETKASLENFSLFVGECLQHVHQGYMEQLAADYLVGLGRSIIDNVHVQAA